MADFEMLEPLPWQPFDSRELAEKGKAIYEKIKDRLEAEHMGEIVVIEVDSGDYFIGKTGLEAVDKAKEKYPNKIFYGIRIGRRAYVSYRAGGQRQ